MAHCAEINNQGIVTRVIVVDEMYGNLTCEEWCEKTYGGMWKKTSYNTLRNKHSLGGVPFRKNYAGIGWKYDFGLDAFIPPKPFPSWILDTETCSWKSPTPKKPGKKQHWDESTGDYVLDE